jgi:hypothetical protein
VKSGTTPPPLGERAELDRLIARSGAVMGFGCIVDPMRRKQNYMPTDRRNTGASVRARLLDRARVPQSDFQ